MSDAQLEELLASQPEEVRNEITRINTDARPLALRIALPVPILAGVAGLVTSFRMMRLPHPKPSGTGEGAILGWLLQAPVLTKNSPSGDEGFTRAPRRE